MKKKVGVLLINLGTPDSPKVGDVRRYLTEFLNDPRVIDIPTVLRAILVNGIIVPFRAPKSAKIYKQLFDLNGGKSPLLEYGYKVRDILRERLAGHADVELAMRYGKPSLDEVAEKMNKAGYDRIIVFPLFPQYASASTGSALEKAMKLIRKWYVIPEIEIISQFYDHPGYINTVVDQAKKHDLKEYDHILFSYHGLPVRQVNKIYEDKKCSNHSCEDEINDENRFCYKATCYATTRLIAEKMGITERITRFVFNPGSIRNGLSHFLTVWSKNGERKVQKSYWLFLQLLWLIAWKPVSRLEMNTKRFSKSTVEKRFNWWRVSTTTRCGLRRWNL